MPLAWHPVAFAVVELLANNNELNPSEISRAVARSVQRVSTVLGALRQRLKAQSLSTQTPAGGPERSRLAFPFREGRFCGGRVIASRCFIPTFSKFRKRGSLA